MAAVGCRSASMVGRATLTMKKSAIATNAPSSTVARPIAESRFWVVMEGIVDPI